MNKKEYFQLLQICKECIKRIEKMSEHELEKEIMRKIQSCIVMNPTEQQRKSRKIFSELFRSVLILEISRSLSEIRKDLEKKGILDSDKNTYSFPPDNVSVPPDNVAG